MQSCCPSMFLIPHPPEKLFIDFAGHTLPITDPHTGQLTHCQVFIACLPYSDYGFAMAVKTQQLEDFIHALVCCLNALGGVPRALVPDNMKSAIIKTSRLDPDITRTLTYQSYHTTHNSVPA